MSTLNQITPKQNSEKVHTIMARLISLFKVLVIFITLLIVVPLVFVIAVEVIHNLFKELIRGVAIEEEVIQITQMAGWVDTIVVMRKEDCFSMIATMGSPLEGYSGDIIVKEKISMSKANSLVIIIP